MRLLNLPLPIFSAILAPQVEPPGAAQAPAWVAAFFAGVFTLGWFLQQWGKLPGAVSDRRAGGFWDTDRAHLDQVHEVVTREDQEKPGWRMVWHSSKEVREMREAIARLAGLAEVWVQDREDWRRDREEWRQDRARMETRITNLEEVNRLQEHALDRGAGGR